VRVPEKFKVTLPADIIAGDSNKGARLSSQNAFMLLFLSAGDRLPAGFRNRPEYSAQKKVTTTAEVME
jgi:hypothetical protein